LEKLPRKILRRPSLPARALNPAISQLAAANHYTAAAKGKSAILRARLMAVVSSCW
jgi:hypothetical protein